MGEIVSLVRILYSNHMLPTVPNDLIKKVTRLELALHEAYDAEETDALMTDIVENIACDLNLAIEVADDMFSNAFEGY